jgi:hypothetical protein
MLKHRDRHAEGHVAVVAATMAQQAVEGGIVVERALYL